MPQLQNLVLTDRATTPVNFTFTPAGIDPRTGVATVVHSDGTLIGEKRFSIHARKVSNGAKWRVNLQLAVPVVQTQTINGVSTPVVVRTSYAKVEFTFDSESSTQERKDVEGMLYSALATGKVLVEDAVVSAQGIY